MQRRGVRNGKIRYYCKACCRSFFVNRSPKINKTKFLIQHIDGTPFRKIASQNNFSHMTAYRYCLDALKELPHCADVTRSFCNRFSGILVLDGKFIKVKGYKAKIPVLYGIDYLTHDIPTYKFTVAENYQSLLSFFTSLRLLNYPLKALVCDENPSFRDACSYVYPKIPIQLCQNHFKNNIKNSLDLRYNPKYLPFMVDIKYLFLKRRSLQEFDSIARKILIKYHNYSLCTKILLDIQNKKPFLLAHLLEKNIPRTNNIIESFNSHLQGRLETIKGFESFSHAELWLNAFFLKRRFTKFTDCEGKFKHLNGRLSIQQTLKVGIDLPRIF